MGALVLSSTVVVANVMGAGMIVPQVVRLQRRRRTAGVSPVWVGIGIALNAWWLVYALCREAWGLAPVAAASAVLYGVIAGQVARIDGRRRLPLVGRGAVVASMAPALAFALGGLPVAGVVMGLSYAVQFSPAMWSVARADDAAGVSPTTWTMAWIEAAAWLGYGLVLADPALVIGGGGGAIMSSAILAALARTDRPARVAAASAL